MRNLNTYQKIAIIMIMIIILSEITISFPFFIKNPDFKILNYNGSAIEYKISAGSYPLELQIVFLSAEREPIIRTVYIYYDPEYQRAGVPKKQARGLVDHIPSELKIRKYEGEIHIVNATALVDLLLDIHSANQSILVITTGAFPDTVYTLDKNLIKPWIEAGGILFWIGDTFAYYSAEKSKKELNWNDPRHPKDEGRVKFFGTKDIIIKLQRGTIASVESEYSKALHLLYPYISRGINITKLKSMNGKILGKIGEKSTSIALLPLGNGSIIIFGGEMHKRDEWIIAKDIAQIITSGILDYKNINIIGFKKYSLDRNEELKDIFLIEKDHQSQAIIIFIFQSNDEPVFFKILE